MAYKRGWVAAFTGVARVITGVATVMTGVATVISGANAGESMVLAGETLREAVAGKIVYLATPAGDLPISYRPNGTMSARSRMLAQFTGSEADTGTWWVTRDRLCQQWATWLDGKAFCYTLRREGPLVHWTRNDGRSGTATIAR